jgi:hypothetical protein
VSVTSTSSGAPTAQSTLNFFTLHITATGSPGAHRLHEPRFRFL